MSPLARWGVRMATGAGITLLLWIVALLSSMVPTVVALNTNVHGLTLADYRQEPPRILAPLSSRVLRDAQQDQSTARPSPTPSPSAGPSSSAGPSPTPSIPPTPVPTASPTPLPSLPPLPTPSVPPLPTPTPTIPVPTPTLPPPPPIP